LLRDITEDDLVRLTEIRIKRISKFNTFKADEEIAKLSEELAQTKHHLEHLTEYAIAYFETLLSKYGKGRERKTEIAVFDEIRATEVVANNAKLYVNRAEGFIGMGLKKDEWVQDCSDIDDIIVFRRDGVMKVVKIGEKVFVGKDILHVAVWKKNDERTTYNMAYLDAGSGRTYVKRFNVTAITRDKDYQLGSDAKGSKVLYFTINPNGESELVSVTLTQNCTAKIKLFDYDFSELGIKGRDAQGNILTKYPVRNIKQKEAGKSTIGARKVWFDNITGRLNNQERGALLGEFDTGDTIIVLYNNGSYEVTDTDVQQRFDMKEILHVGKFTADTVVSAIHFDGHKGFTMVKRFRVETNKLRERYSYLTDHAKSKMLYVSVQENPHVKYTIKVNGKPMTGDVHIADFIDVKGWKAVGNRLADHLVTQIKEIEPSTTAAIPASSAITSSVEAVTTVAEAALPTADMVQGSLFDEPVVKPEKSPKATPKPAAEKTPGKGSIYKAGDVIEFD
jgi:topoisomerase IV subunit A